MSLVHSHMVIVNCKRKNIFHGILRLNYAKISSRKVIVNLEKDATFHIRVNAHMAIQLDYKISNNRRKKACISKMDFNKYYCSLDQINATHLTLI